MYKDLLIALLFMGIRALEESWPSADGSLPNEGAAIIILKMEENKQHFRDIMLCYLKKGKNTTETQNDLCSVWRRCCD